MRDRERRLKEKEKKQRDLLRNGEREKRHKDGESIKADKAGGIHRQKARSRERRRQPC